MFHTRVQIFKIACTSINHMSFYETRNPVFAFLLSIIENFLCQKTAIVRQKHVSIMDTRKVMHYGSKETQRKKLFFYLCSLCKTVCSFVISI